MHTQQTAPSSIKSRLLAEGLDRLSQAGARFVVEADGIRYGDPVFLNEVSAKPKPQRVMQFNHKVTHGYRELLGAAEPGDEVLFRCASHPESDSLRCSLLHWMQRHRPAQAYELASSGRAEPSHWVRILLRKPAITADTLSQLQLT